MDELERLCDEFTEHSGDILGFVLRAAAPFNENETTKYVLLMLHVLACTAVDDTPVQTHGASWTRANVQTSLREFANRLAFDVMCADDVVNDNFVRGALWLAQQGPGGDETFTGALDKGAPAAWDALCAAFALLHFIATRRELDRTAVVGAPDPALAAVYARYTDTLRRVQPANISSRTHGAVVAACTPPYAHAQFILRTQRSTPFLSFTTRPYISPVGTLAVVVGSHANACDDNVVREMFGDNSDGWRAPLKIGGMMQLAMATLVVEMIDNMTTHGGYAGPVTPAPRPRGAPYIFTVGAIAYFFDEGVIQRFSCLGTAFMLWRRALRARFDIRAPDGVSRFET